LHGHRPEVAGPTRRVPAQDQPAPAAGEGPRLPGRPTREPLDVGHRGPQDGGRRVARIRHGPGRYPARPDPLRCRPPSGPADEPREPALVAAAGRPVVVRPVDSRVALTARYPGP